MIFVPWSSAPKERLIFDAIVPGINKKLTLSQAVEHAKKTVPTIENKNQRWRLTFYVKTVTENLKDRNLDNLDKITFGDVSQITKKLTQSQTDKIRIGLATLIRWCLVGKLTTGNLTLGVAPNAVTLTKDADVITLKIQSAPLETLEDMLIHGNGKYLEIQTQVFDSIATCPPNEYRVIPATKEIIENKKQREALRQAIGKSIASKGWVIRWAGARKVFFVVQADILNKIKKGAKP